VSTLDAQASVVLVDGLVNGDTKDTTGASLTLDDVRVCIRNATTKAPITQYALPDSTTMPLTNYPGIHRGGGVDLGSIKSFDVEVDVFSASDLAGDATWSSSRGNFTCQLIEQDQNSLPARPHARFSVTLKGGVNVLALVDAADDAGATVGLEQRSFDDVTFAGAEGSLWGTVVDFSGWHAASQVGAYFGNPVDGSGPTNDAIVDPIDSKKTPSPHEIAKTIDGYETLGVRFDALSGGQPADRFGQSLDSIAFVSDAVVTPPEFYGVRANFVFALVGDPNDPTSVKNSGGRDPAFDGRGLHVVAVPYATPLPQ